MKKGLLLLTSMLALTSLVACKNDGASSGAGSESESSESSGEPVVAHWYDDYVGAGFTFSESFPLAQVKAWYENEGMSFVEITAESGFAFKGLDSAFVVALEGDVSSSVLELFGEGYTVDTSTYDFLAMVEPTSKEWHLDVYYADQGEDTLLQFLPVCLTRTEATDWTDDEKELMLEEIGYVMPFFAFGADYVVSSVFDYGVSIAEMYYDEYAEAMGWTSLEDAIEDLIAFGMIPESYFGYGIYISDTYVYDLRTELNTFITGESMGFVAGSSAGSYTKSDAGSLFTIDIGFINPGSAFILTKEAYATGLAFYDYNDESETAITSCEIGADDIFSLTVAATGGSILSTEVTYEAPEGVFEIDEEYWDWEYYGSYSFLDFAAAENAEPGTYSITFSYGGETFVFSVTIVGEGA